MPTRRDAALLEAEREGEGATASDAAPKLVLALGRGKTGKSTFIRWAAEGALERGAEPVIADADRTNATLAAFFENVARPDSPEDEDVRFAQDRPHGFQFTGSTMHPPGAELWG